MSQRTKLIEREEVAKAIVGQVEIVREVLTAIVSGGHVLMIGMPGLAKTTLYVRTIADVLHPEFRPHPIHARPDAQRHHRHGHSRGR